MQWLRSLATPDSVAVVVREAYALEVSGCELVRSFVNDVYRVDTVTGPFALKIYRHGGWSPDEVAWEQGLISHAAEAGAPVVAPVALSDGRLAGEVPYPEGVRPFALSPWVPGRKPRPPFTDEVYRAFGEVIGQFHAAGDTFRSAHSRRPFELGRDLDDSLAGVLEQLSEQPADRRIITDLAAHARGRIADLGQQGADWGICHGDVTMDNIHVTDQGVVLHDFDLAREGWRVGDLTGVRTTPHWDAFADGYTQRRELRTADLAALPWLQVVDLVSNLHFHLVRKPATRGTESLTEGWVDRELDSLRRLGADLLS